VRLENRELPGGSTATSEEALVLRCLARQPPCISPDIDHGNRCTALQSRDQFKEECSRSLSLRHNRVATVRIAHKHSVRRYTSQVQSAIWLGPSQCVKQRLAQRWIPVTFKCEEASYDALRWLRREGAASRGDGKTGAMQSANTCNFLLSVRDFLCIDALFGFESSIDAFCRDYCLSLKLKDKG
jgi:hypothetical protein